MDSRDLVDRLFDPTFNTCRDDAEFDLAWAVQSRLHEVMQRSGKLPPLKDKASIRRRQAAERDADERLAAQRERVDPEVHYSDEEDEAAYAAVRAEVPPDVRIDGWTARRRILFLEKLEEHGCVVDAAAHVGMSRRSVNRLRDRAPAFAAAYETALARTCDTLFDTLFHRALRGHEVPVVYKGDVVATRTVHHDRLGLHLLMMRDPLRFAPLKEAERFLGNQGLKAIEQRDPPAALSRPAAGPPSGLDRVAEGNKDSLDRVAAGNEHSPAALPVPNTAVPLDLPDLVQETPSRDGTPATLPTTIEEA